jgi:hypothetical protein
VVWAGVYYTRLSLFSSWVLKFADKMASKKCSGGVEADVSLLRGFLEDIRGPLHRVLCGNRSLGYPCCSWAAASLVGRYLWEAGFNAEVVPLAYIRGCDVKVVRGLADLSVSEREPARIRELFGKGVVDSLSSNAHQAVGVRFSSGKGGRFFFVDFLLPQLFGSVGSNLDYVFSEVDAKGLLERYGLIVVSPKFVRFPRVQCSLFDVVGCLAVDLSDDYREFKRLVDAVRGGY